MTREELGVVAGQVVAGKYRLVELLGRGGMGSVWRADHLALLSPIALKVIKPQIARNATSLTRFMREAKAAAMLRSPHVVQILDHGTDGDVAFIAMELLDGESLFQRLERDKMLSPRLVLTVMTHIGRAIGRAHEAGIVHRDLKPDNVFLVPNDDEIVAKVLDFGIAKDGQLALGSDSEGPQTRTGTLLGTPYYMSPEQATGDKGIDHRTDLWAMGVIAYECLCGRRPFQSDSLGDLVLQICAKPPPVPSQQAAVPMGFDAWFARATERDVTKRFQSARELVAALRAVLAPSSNVAPTTAQGPAEANASERRESGGAVAVASAPDAAPERVTGHTASSGETVVAPSDELPLRASAAGARTTTLESGVGSSTLSPKGVPRHSLRGLVLAALALLLAGGVAIVIATTTGRSSVDRAAGAGAASDATGTTATPSRSVDGAPASASGLAASASAEASAASAGVATESSPPSASVATTGAPPRLPPPPKTTTATPPPPATTTTRSDRLGI